MRAVNPTVIRSSGSADIVNLRWHGDATEAQLVANLLVNELSRPLDPADMAATLEAVRLGLQ